LPIWSRRNTVPDAMRGTKVMRWALAMLVLAACSKSGDAPGEDPAPAPGVAEARGLKVGVTLHPYYSWTKHVVGDVAGVEVVAVLPGDVDAGAYQPSAADIQKLSALDVLVVNGLGHDDFIDAMVTASGNTRLVTIDVNAATPTLTSPGSTTPNSHTFLSYTNAIQQTRVIATRLGELRPEHAEAFAANATAYVARLRAQERAAIDRLAGAAIKRVVTVHDGYSYLLQDLGIELVGVVEPAHGLVPSASELGAMIATIARERVTVVLSEEGFPTKLSDTLRDESGASIYVLSHIALGDYTADKFERGMADNIDTLVAALVPAQADHGAAPGEAGGRGR
jgi:zinc transport system substrate-binding protein